jgi:tetratricopeptide (TPR) repeat protein
VLRKAKSISQDGLQQKTILLKLAGILYAQKRFSHALAEFENDTLPGDMPNTLAHSNSSQQFLKKMVEEKIAKIRSEINRERKNREQDKRLQKKIKTDFALGAAAIHRRHWEKAIRAFQNVLLMDRNHHEARKQLLVARSALKKDKAYGLLRNYFTELDSLYDLAQNFHKNNDARQYLGTLEKIQAIAPGYRNVNDLRRRALKNRQSSQHGTGRILPLPNDHSSGLLRWVGYVLVCLVALIFAWIKFSPFARAQLYWKIGKFDLAAKIYEKLLLQNPGRIKLYLRLAEIYLALDRRDAQALRIFKTIHKLNLQTPLQKRIGMVLARVVA